MWCLRVGERNLGLSGRLSRRRDLSTRWVGSEFEGGVRPKE